MGRITKGLQYWSENISSDRPWLLRLNGIFITLFLISISGLAGWSLEQLTLTEETNLSLLSNLILLIALASGLATKSLLQAVQNVIKSLLEENEQKELYNAKKKLKQIVGREVDHLNKSEILRATAETASENAVDGIFAPLFWMIIGAVLWQFSTNLPGPLTLVWIYKASSTLDSMIGYRHGRLKWLGTAAARLEDFLTWIPCRLVVATLPIASNYLKRAPILIKAAWQEGSKDQSPNSGLSEAIFAHCAQVRMGGINKYKNKIITKPILAGNAPEADIDAIKKILNLILRLEFLWLIIVFIGALVSNQ